MGAHLSTHAIHMTFRAIKISGDRLFRTEASTLRYRHADGHGRAGDVHGDDNRFDRGPRRLTGRQGGVVLGVSVHPCVTVVGALRLWLFRQPLGNR